MSETYNKACVCGADDWVISSITLHCKKCARVYQKIEGDWIEVREDMRTLFAKVRNLKFENARLKQQLGSLITTLTSEREAPLVELRKSLGASSNETTWDFIIRLFIEKNELADVLRMLYDEIKSKNVGVAPTCLERLNRLFEDQGTKV